MIVLGIDVGIKNLGYCLIEKTDKDRKILEWDIFNIIKETNDICTIPNCKKTAKYIHNNIQLCGIHAKTYAKKNLKSKIEIEEKYKKTLKKGVCSLCAKKSQYLHIETGTHYCTTHYNSDIKSTIRANQLEKIKLLNSKTIGLELICKELINFVNNERFLNVDIVKIENQHQKDIVLTMKTISVMLYTLFTAKYIGKQTKVLFVNASTKISFDKQLFNDSWEAILSHRKSLIVRSANIDGEITLTTTKCKKSCKICCLDNDFKNNGFPQTFEEYLNRKNKDKLEYLSLKYLSILKVAHLAGENFAMIKNHSKKDDLCDAFLYADSQ